MMSRLRRLPIDLVLLGELAGIGALIGLFLLIGSQVSSLRTDDLDRSILLALRHAPDDPIGSDAFQGGVMHISALGSGAVTGLIVLVATLYFALAGRWRYALLMLAVALGTLLAMELLKELYGRERPTVVTSIDPPGGLSFPSGHSMISMSLYLTLGMLVAQAQRTRRLKGFAIATSAVIALMIGTSRMYLGVHYPTDVLAGWTAGATWALICAFVIRRIGRRRIEGEQAPDAAAA